ncbi:MAG: hypothetical protein UIH41_03545 [Treponemataceae bacterium]|nr:hypothetical protein [Treponemataceae bacterium]
MVKKICVLWIFLCFFSFGYSEDIQDFEAENDNYVISSKNHNNLVYTYTLENELIRKEYDEKKRLIKKISWNITDESKNYEINYEYDDNSMLPKYSERTSYLTNQTITAKSYYWKTEEGNNEKICLYRDDVLYLEQYYLYDFENRIKTYTEKKYENGQLEYDEQVIYEYVIFESETFFNEYHFSCDVNDPLKKTKTMERVYTSKTEYFENTFFEDGIRIYTEYENGLIKLEMLYFGDKGHKVK